MEPHQNTPFNPALELQGYTPIEKLYTGSRTMVYRARSERQQQPVVIKVLRQAYPSFGEIVQFRNQYAITKNLDIPGIVRPLSLEPWRNSYALVMEDNGSISLAQYVQSHQLDIETGLHIAIQLAETLHHLHGSRVIHKDIKPANILIHPETHQVQAIDFSIASLLPKETQEIQNPNVLEGTLAYIAPEQTGRMNRGIDYRTDFYSLGVTLYELFAGQLPFSTQDPLELVHAHLAQFPPAPDRVNPELPPIISALILKLMAKNAEERYQSALGLKHDLEICLQQWRETGQIVEFELGKQDWCDRFIIPEKLYGREAEVAQLLAAFERVSARGQSAGERDSQHPTAEMMLVAGFSGIGKTAVINEVHKPITRQRGYFIKGKFDQFNRNIPFSAFVQAFRDLMGQLLAESDAQLQTWKARILEIVGDSGQVLIEVIPELEGIVGSQPPASELSGSAARERFNLLFQKFIGIFARPEHPLVIFLDDLQWVDSASLYLIELLMQERSDLLLLGAYRDNEVSPAHPFILTVEELKRAGKTVETITLAPLTFEDTNQLVADTLNCSSQSAQSLSQPIERNTKGNPFFLTQFLKALYEDKQIIFNRDSNCWECDLGKINALSVTEDVVDFMAQRLQTLAPETQQVLKLAACIGNRFDLETLAIVSEQSREQVADALWTALQEGLVLPQTEIYKFYLDNSQRNDRTQSAENVFYRFLHDRVQQAAYSLIPTEQKDRIHYQIGQLLLQKISPEAKEERIFELVNQLNHGTGFIDEQEERERLAELNLLACRRARAATAYQAGRDYANTGILLLGETAWERQYELCLPLHELAAELASLCGDFEAMAQSIEEVIARARCLIDRVNIYCLKIQVLASHSQFFQAIDLARSLLQQFGTSLPETPTPEEIQQSIVEIARLIGDREIEALVDLPVMTDGEKIAVVRILSSSLSAAMMSGSPLYPLLVALAVKLSIEYGNIQFSAFGYASYGLLLCNLFKQIDTGIKFGNLALKLARRVENKSVKPGVLIAATACILHHNTSVKSTLELILEAYKSSLENGDSQVVGYAISTFQSHSLFSGQNLIDSAKKSQAYYEQCHQLNIKAALKSVEIYWQAMLNLIETVENPTVLSGTALNEEESIADSFANNDIQSVYIIKLYKLILSYLFGEIESARKNASEMRPYLMGMIGTVCEPALYFYESLAALSDLNVFSSEASARLEQVEKNQTELRLFWAELAPMNYQHKVDLVEAEKCRVLDRKLEAIELYDRAIAGAKENEYIQEEALANELAAKFYLAWGKERIAQSYMQDAYYGYARWGAKAKTDDLERRYPALLHPILELEVQPLNPIDTLVTLSSQNISLQSSSYVTRSSSSSFNNTLDFAAVLKAAQSISGTLKLEELLVQLTGIVLRNAGADRCALILPQKTGEWRVEAIATLEETQLSSQPLEGDRELPVKLIQYVKNTGTAIATDSLKTNLPIRDPYLNQNHPQSLLVQPILDRGRLVGLLYLENRLTRGAFTQERLLVLNFLCSQAAISLENARLYKEAQNYAQQLEESQLQIVQSEKMASLGNLVAGVAHEINNPIGFLNGSVSNAKEYVRDLLGHLELYEQYIPNPPAPLSENAEDIDLEFLGEDLPKLLESMQGAIDRIKGISTSLRVFSRADCETPVRANLHEGLDSTLLILKYRLKANEQRPAIEVVKDYGQIPEIECFPGQLNQVFMNLIANAIDALDEAAQQHSYQELEAQKQQIFLQTALNESGNDVQIRIGDNGMGIPESLQSKIFEHLFTTKGVGKGTGLGLAIARQIVVEKHRGKIEVRSFTAETAPSAIARGTEFCIRLPLSPASYDSP